MAMTARGAPSGTRLPRGSFAGEAVLCARVALIWPTDLMKADGSRRRQLRTEFEFRWRREAHASADRPAAARAPSIGAAFVLSVRQASAHVAVWGRRLRPTVAHRNHRVRGGSAQWSTLSAASSPRGSPQRLEPLRTPSRALCRDDRGQVPHVAISEGVLASGRHPLHARASSSQGADDR